MYTWTIWHENMLLARNNESIDQRVHASLVNKSKYVNHKYVNQKPNSAPYKSIQGVLMYTVHASLVKHLSMLIKNILINNILIKNQSEHPINRFRVCSCKLEIGRAHV